MLVTMACAVQFFSRHGDDVAPDLGPWWDSTLVWPPLGERLHRPGPWSVRRSRIRRHHAITRVADTPFPFFTPLNGYHRHILAINNDPAGLARFRDLLEEAGYQVSTQNYVDRDLAQPA